MISLECALAEIPGLSGALRVRQLSNGPTNSSFLLDRSGEKFVIRLDKPAARELGLDRQNEEQVLTSLAAEGLAPLPEYCDLARGVLLRRYLPGDTWTKENLHDRDCLLRLARLLRRVHSVTPTGITFDPLGAARRYARQLGTAGSTEILQRAEQLAGELASWPDTPVLCHNDPVCHNVIEAEPLTLIDWEYAAAGDRYFDLAVVTQHHRLGDALSRVFLEEYLGFAAGAAEQEHLSRQRAFYQCLLDLWNLRLESPEVSA